jgi:hypothetical protein
MESGDVLLQRLLAGDPDPDGDLENDLLKAIFAGYPKERLRLLLASDDDTAIEAVAWILSELGASATPLLADAAPLLTHRARVARAYTLDVVLKCAGPQDSAILAQAVLLSDDPDAGVQWKALRFLTALRAPLLEAARAALPERFRALVRWLLDSDVGAASPEEMRTLLRDPDPLQRRFAAVALARSRNRAALLALADEITDPFIQDFVRTLTLDSPMAHSTD